MGVEYFAIGFIATIALLYAAGLWLFLDWLLERAGKKEPDEEAEGLDGRRLQRG